MKRQKFLLFFNNIQQGLKQRMENIFHNYEVHTRCSKRNNITLYKQLRSKKVEQARIVRVSVFGSKAMSKYILLNVMEFLNFKNDLVKARLICRKFRDAADMHLLKLSNGIRNNLYKNFTALQIKEGEEMLCNHVNKFTTRDFYTR
jgi:hypothetical protein